MHQWKIYHHGPESGGTPKSAVLMLHGVGSNGRDLIGLAPHLARNLPDTVFLSPDGLQPFDMVPGFAMEDAFQWFSLQSRAPADLMAEATASFPAVNELIDRVADEFKISPSKIALLGFSQGTMMALFTALRRQAPVAGVLGYSGILLDETGFDGFQKMPVCLIHGQADDVVAFTHHGEAVTRLQQAGYDVDSLAIPHLPHSIDMSGIERGAAFLQRVLA
jgi:phospholipase/carboxylesterase